MKIVRLTLYMFNIIFNNISAILWWSVLFTKITSSKLLSHDVISSTSHYYQE